MPRHFRSSCRLYTVLGNLLAAALALGLAAAGGQAGAAPLDPVSPPIRINVGPPEAVQTFNVEVNNPGAGVALWEEQDADGRYSTYFRRFDRQGLLAPLQTLAQSTELPLAARVLKVFDTGKFLVENRVGRVVRLHLFTAGGALLKVLPEIECKTANCTIAVDDQGDMAIVDVSEPIGVTPGSPFTDLYRYVVAQLRCASGKIVKPWFVVNQPVADDPGIPDGPAVAVDADGDFAVGWGVDRDLSCCEGGFVRLFHKTGRPRGNRFQLAEDFGVHPSPVGFAMDRDGDFVVSWADFIRPSHGIISFDVFRKDGVAVDRPICCLDVLPGTVKPLMDDDGDFGFAVTQWSPLGYDAGWAWLELYQPFTAVQLAGRQIADYDLAAPGFPRIVTDAGMDASGRIAALWVQTFENTGGTDPLGLLLQRFAGPGD